MNTSMKLLFFTCLLLVGCSDDTPIVHDSDTQTITAVQQLKPSPFITEEDDFKFKYTVEDTDTEPWILYSNKVFQVGDTLDFSSRKTTPP